jgi:hypothetical protein
MGVQGLECHPEYFANEVMTEEKVRPQDEVGIVILSVAKNLKLSGAMLLWVNTTGWIDF